MITEKVFEFSELQEKWLQLLETTKLKQGRKFLRLGDSYCCLGIAAELILDITPKKCHKDGTSDVYEFEGNIDKLNKKAVKKLGLLSPTGDFNVDRLEPEHIWSSLVELNDEGEYSFKEIAKFIRSNPLTVFKDPSL